MLKPFTKNFYPLYRLEFSLFKFFLIAMIFLPIHSYGQHIWLEPECGSPGSNWTVERDPQASGEQYLTYKLNDSFSEPPASGADQLRVPFKVVQAGNYKFWARTKAPQNAGDSFWFRIDNGEWVKWKNLKKGDTFNWIQVQDHEKDNENVVVNLTAGEHLITIGYREMSGCVEIQSVDQRHFSPYSS